MPWDVNRFVVISRRIPDTLVCTLDRHKSLIGAKHAGPGPVFGMDRYTPSTLSPIHTVSSG